jgi:hypothetical protein
LADEAALELDPEFILSGVMPQLGGNLRSARRRCLCSIASPIRCQIDRVGCSRAKAGKEAAIGSMVMAVPSGGSGGV